MKNLILIFCAVACLTAACTNGNSFVIKGTLSDDTFDNAMVYLFDYEQTDAIDSTVIKNSTFEFKGNVENISVCFLSVNRMKVSFILEQGNILIDFSNPVKIEGTELNKELSKYLLEINSINKSLSDYYTELKNNDEIDESEREDLFAIYEEEMDQKKDAVFESFFVPNKDNPLGAFVLWQWSYDLTSEVMKTLYETAGTYVKNFPKIKEVLYKNERLAATSAGMLFTDFTIENGTLDGDPVSLSDYVGKGKYVLVDFWASWCGPCIREIPVLKDVYEKYQGDNFELLGVAVWDKREETLLSIEKHEMTWHKIIDAQSIPTDLYGIRSIPQIILFGPDGTIIARNLRGDAIKQLLDEVL
ncbi:MAG: AhpC/TSA family protein [Marinilabiliaceae bacterium]|nr:AhpC/TSA family protein [Marinilabiliaceae bacterium]